MFPFRYLVSLPRVVNPIDVIRAQVAEAGLTLSHDVAVEGNTFIVKIAPGLEPEIVYRRMVSAIDKPRLWDIIIEMDSLLAPILEWWQKLVYGVDKVRPVHDGVRVLRGDGREFGVFNKTDDKGQPVIWDTWSSVDVSGKMIRIYKDAPPSLPGGLWVAAGDVVKA